MAKFLLIGLFCLAAFGQIATARDLAETINNNIREQLKGYEEFLEKDDGSHKEDLKKLIELTETALKVDGAEEKQSMLNNIPQNFTPEFNKFITEKLQDYQITDSINDAIKFYKSLLSSHPEFKDEIEKTVASLESLLKETDVQKKGEGFQSLDKNFSPEFAKFLKDNALPNVNRELQKTVEFFENLLVGDDAKFEKEIKELKAEAEAALDDKLSVDDKQKALFKVTNPESRELFDYLHKKFVELN